MNWERGKNDREFLTWARGRIVKAIAYAEDGGGCAGFRVHSGTGQVCAIGALTASRLGLNRKRLMEPGMAHEVHQAGDQAEDSVIWADLSQYLLHTHLWTVNDSSHTPNPPVTALNLLLRRVEQKLACLGTVENHELEPAK